MTPEAERALVEPKGVVGLEPYGTMRRPAYVSSEEKVLGGHVGELKKTMEFWGSRGVGVGLGVGRPLVEVQTVAAMSGMLLPPEGIQPVAEVAGWLWVMPLEDERKGT